GEARLIRAEALRRLGRAADAEREYRAYVDAYPKSWREAEARFRVAEAIEAAAGGGAHEAGAGRGIALPAARWAEARAQYLIVYVQFPTESWARQAAARLAAIEP